MMTLCKQIDSSDNAVALANNNPGAKQNNNAKKARVEHINKTMRDYNDKLGHIQHTIEREHASISHNVREMKWQTKELMTGLRENKELVELRKEQAEELKTKYGANFHSSYLGLWRPLHPETHAVIYTISIVLVLVSVVGLAYVLFRNGFPVFSNLFASASAKTADAFNEAETAGALLGGGGGGGGMASKLMKLLRRK